MWFLALALADTGDSGESDSGAADTAAPDSGGGDTGQAEVLPEGDEFPALLTGVEGIPFVLQSSDGPSASLEATNIGPVSCTLDRWSLVCEATDNGTTEFELRYHDEQGDRVSQSLTVTAINADPAFTWTPSAAPMCGRPTPFSAASFLAPTGGPISYTFDVADVPADRLSFEVSGAPDSLSLSQHGVLAWTPGLDDLGTWPIEITVRDDDGGEDTLAFEAEVVLDPCAWMSAAGIVGALSARRLRRRAHPPLASP